MCSDQKLHSPNGTKVFKKKNSPRVKVRMTTTTILFECREEIIFYNTRDVYVI